MSETPQKNPSKTGAVTFLDVLGWKGMWLLHENPIPALLKVVERTREEATKISKQYAETKEFRGIENITEVISISDTIAIFSEGETELTIELQAKICSWLLEHALSEEKIPLRGAISYGSYSKLDNVMQGRAVDEAASWYEFVDWIGVVLTPSAHLKISQKKSITECITHYEKIPFKKSVPNLNTCVDWNFNAKMKKLEEIVVEMGVLTPEIAPKYLNTLAFLNRKKSNRKKT